MINDKKAEALSNYFGVSKNEVEQTEYDTSTYIVNDKEYMVLDDNDANDCVYDIIKNDIYDGGIEAFTPEMKARILSFYCDETDFAQAYEDMEWAYIEDIKDEDDEEYGTRLEREMQEAGVNDEEEYVDYLLSQYDNFAESFCNDFGVKCFNEFCEEHSSLDIDGIVDECVMWDGRGCFIASYDAKEIELEDGLYAYRQS